MSKTNWSLFERTAPRCIAILIVASLIYGLDGPACGQTGASGGSVEWLMAHQEMVPVPGASPALGAPAYGAPVVRCTYVQCTYVQCTYVQCTYEWCACFRCTYLWCSCDLQLELTPQGPCR